MRLPLLFLVLLAILGQSVLPYDLAWWVVLPALGGAMALYAFVGRVRAEPLLVEPPVRGRWRALNSPASRVPSHGLHAYGQTYAIDLVFDPPGFSRPRGFRRAAEFPGFGRPVLAAAPGRVVRVSQWQRDHRSRTSLPALLYLLAEGMVREFLGAGRVVGNHIVVDLGDGRYALYAHLRRHSATVRPGDRVVAGQELARCGNSGNSSEPHLHFQLMDHPRPAFAAGLPFDFAGGVPCNGALLAPESSLQSL
ncbi:M23 family metallopeptidase [Paractinoplanes rhizophilus]|uniref:M23 family metallopeptidase n=1 Tax=Paractinoplanes rhizophilus TaxID=1416877 RepID=A0ABW2I5J7_9ACTN